MTASAPTPAGAARGRRGGDAPVEAARGSARCRPIRPLLLAALGLLPWGCLSTTSTVALTLAPAEWRLAVSRRGVQGDAVPNPMEATEAMREAAREWAGIGGPEEKLARIQGALNDPAGFHFRYDLEAALTAPEAFSARRGNCVSYVSLFIALARSVDVPLSAALLLRPTKSERRGEFVLVLSHLVAVYLHGRAPVVYDLGLSRRMPAAILRPFDDLAVAGLLASNQGVARLLCHDLASARTMLEVAARMVPDFAPVYGNLGLARQREGDVEGAIEAYHRGLEVDPGATELRRSLALLGCDR
ncbi:MAG: hypothetical protein HY900_37700 [Deltaproteobacteria bacterium]|nr:hypothetical protein [Deltaproteobacteria bacterium]